MRYEGRWWKQEGLRWREAVDGLRSLWCSRAGQERVQRCECGDVG